MNAWYRDYWSQTWYRNTFLVRQPNQIARVICHPHEWNNLHDSGCNFTCLAMIVGIDPARLASELSAQKYFFADQTLKAENLVGKTGGLVWDQDAPHAGKPIKLHNIWHPQLKRRASIKVSFIHETSERNYEDGKRLVAASRKKGRHVICGPEAHSCLVAGTVGKEFFVWDPDTSGTSVESNLAGKFTLRELFQAHEGKPIDFWEYKCDVTAP